MNLNFQTCIPDAECVISLPKVLGLNPITKIIENRILIEPEATLCSDLE